MEKRLEELKRQYMGKPVCIVGNGPSLVTMPGPNEHRRRYQYIFEQKRNGDKTNINDFEQPRALVRRIDNPPAPLWTVNGAWTYHPKSTLGFLMDDHRFHTDATHPQAAWYDSIIKAAEIPIITSTPYPAYPKMLAFPLKEAIKEFKTDYFAESIDYMVALAAMFEVSKIIFLGCDYQMADRFPGERASTEYWIGKVEERGIICDTSHSQNLMGRSPWEKCYHPRIYGYGRDNFPYSDEQVRAWIRGEEIEDEQKKVG